MRAKEYLQKVREGERLLRLLETEHAKCKADIIALKGVSYDKPIVSSGGQPGDLSSAIAKLEYYAERVNQQWAEALARYHEGEKLHLDEITGKAAQEAQEQHRERSAWEGKIEAFLLRPVPVNYDALELPARRMYWSGSASGVETVPRDKVCAAEIWCECLNRDIADIKRKDAVEINNILASLPGWKRTDNSRRFGTHGKQRGFEREA